MLGNIPLASPRASLCDRKRDQASKQVAEKTRSILMSAIRNLSRGCRVTGDTALLHVPHGLYADDGHQFLDRCDAFVERSLLFGGELDLDNLLDALGAEFYRHTHIKALDSVFPFEIGGAGKNLLLVLEDGLDHFGDGGRGGVVGAAGLEILHDF